MKKVRAFGRLLPDSAEEQRRELRRAEDDRRVAEKLERDAARRLPSVGPSELPSNIRARQLEERERARNTEAARLERQAAAAELNQQRLEQRRQFQRFRRAIADATAAARNERDAAILRFDLDAVVAAQARLAMLQKLESPVDEAERRLYGPALNLALAARV